MLSTFINGGHVKTRCILVFVLAITNIIGFQQTLAAQEEVPETGSNKTINVEFVVDASGSMAAATDTGELRITAAQRVLQDVVQAIPEAEGVNVGLRVYGHQGDNSDAGRPVSCESTELLVPIEGVNKPALTSAISTIQPVGWTPLARSLEAAGQDFTTPADENTVNAIVLVTDGLETCDGDPVQVATSLHSSEQGIITHVIGFGTTAEELEILNGIASGGGGQLLGAQNAQELNNALFSILEELEIVVGAGFIGGNAFDVLPTATPGEVSVIGFGAGTYGAFPVVARNDTGQDVSAVKVAITIRGSGGELLASGDTGQGLTPSYVRAGGVAIGSVYLGPDFVIPEGAQVEFDVSFSPAALISPFQPLDMEIVEASQFEDRIVGTLQNGHEVSGELGIRVIAVCFDLNGTPQSVNETYIDRQAFPPGETASFQVDLLGAFLGEECPAFLVAGSAFSPGSLPASGNLAGQQPTRQPSGPAVDTPTPTLAPEAVDGQASPTAEPATVEPTQSDQNPPVPLPTQDPALGSTYSQIAGIEDAVARVFVSPTDLNLYVSTVVGDFESGDLSRAALPVVVDRTNSRSLQIPGVSATLEQVDLPVPDGFDSVNTAVIRLDLGGGTAQYLSKLIAVRGDRMYLVESTSYQPGFDETVVDILSQFVLNPLPRDQATPEEVTYGLWGELPILAEVPAGFVLDAEFGNYVPRSFGPIPPRGQ
jgi:hypothetical protein